MNIWDILLIIVILAAVLLALRRLRKKGGGCSCGSCTGCREKGNCGHCERK